MVNSKKLLSLFLAVVMLVSVFAFGASAWTQTGDVVAGDMNFKYTVEKIDTIPANDATGSEEYSADNIYAVTAWIQSDAAFTVFTAPFYYNKAHFAPVTLVADGMTFPTGAELDQDTYYTDMGEGAIYAYTLGDYMNNTGMYKADGSKATTKALAKCIGLGNSNTAGIDIMTELVSPDHPFYATKWNKGLPEDTGVLYFNAKVTGKSKTAYFNTISGIETSKDWNRMVTVYFETLPGVSADDVNGDVFGCLSTDTETIFMDGATDISGYGYFVNAATAKVGNPNKNLASNAVVEAAATPELVLAALTQQIRFPAGKSTFDYRVFADVTNLEEIFVDVDGVNDDSDNTYATEAGFIYNVGGAIDENTALDQINGGEAVYVQQKHAYISTSTGLADYAMACVIYDIPYDAANETLSVLAYIKYVQDGEAKVALVDAYTGTFEPLFSKHNPNA